MSLFLISLSTLFCLAVNDSQYSTSTAPTDAALTQLAPPCWHNWQAHDARFDDPGYTPMVWRPTDSNVSATGQKAAAAPGRTWLLWNEPESHDQANTAPDVAAAITAKHVVAIGDNSRVACCGVMIGTSGTAWLDAYLAAGGPVPDVWHIHVYGIDVAGWQNAMDYWFWWHAQHGKGKPTIISETSLMWANATEQAKLLRYLQQYNDSRVESIYWFSAFPERSVLSWAGSALLDSSYTKTALGKLYAPTVDSGAVVVTLPDGSSYSITATQVDAVTWSYHVERLSGKDLSHWVLWDNGCTGHVANTYPASTYGKDPTTGTIGWKFEPIVNQSATYVVVMDAPYPAGWGGATMKAGEPGNYKSATIAGPDCTQVDPPTVTPTVTPTPTGTPTPASTATGMATPTATQTATMTPEATQTPTASPTATQTATTTPAATGTPTEPFATPTATPEAPTATMTLTATATTVVGGEATVEATPTVTATTLPTNLGDGTEPAQHRAWLPVAAK